LLKYLLTGLILIFIGCSSEKEESKINTIKKASKQQSNSINIKLNNLTLKFKNNQLIYPNKKIYILFYNNSNYSKMQEEVLKKLNIYYYKTDNNFLKQYFKISNYPTIIILDKNKTIKFENFTPIEILKGF
jgi:hypothetical protein